MLSFFKVWLSKFNIRLYIL